MDECDTTRCEKCSYSAYNGTLGVICEYLLITGHVRGCEPGEACDKFTTEPVGRDPDKWANNFFTEERKYERVRKHSLGLGARRRMKIDKEKLIQLKREGKSNDECAKVFGCHTESVRQMCKKLEAEGRLTAATISNAEDYIAEKQLQSAPEETLSPANAGALPEGEPKTGKTVAERLAEEEAAEAVKRAEGQTPDPEANPKEAPYPIPPIDRKTFWDMRRDELRGAICEYACYGLPIDPEWVEEYNELIGRCNQ